MTSKTYVEILTSYNKKRRYQTPLFLTPHGIIKAFPEKDEDAFASSSDVWEATAEAKIKNWGMGYLKDLWLSRRYKDWKEKVKPVIEQGEVFSEKRLTRREAFELYQQGGKPALRKLYTSSHVHQLIDKFKEEGWLEE